MCVLLHVKILERLLSRCGLGKNFLFIMELIVKAWNHIDLWDHFVIWASVKSIFASGASLSPRHWLGGIKRWPVNLKFWNHSLFLI